MKEEGVKIIGGALGHTTIIIDDDFQVPEIEEGQKAIEENLKIIDKLK